MNIIQPSLSGLWEACCQPGSSDSRTLTQVPTIISRTVVSWIETKYLHKFLQDQLGTFIQGGSSKLKKLYINPVVNTRLGRLKGSKMKTTRNREVLSFRGIPYAVPPTGKLRFKRSREATSAWSGTLSCTKESPECIQPNLFFPNSRFKHGTEDCLYLNVFTKSVTNASLPVIVFLHGGAFVVGSNETKLYGPSVLLDRDVVLVTVNYRLGALGWLTLETDEAPGNLGLHDQYLALCWVKSNIAAFGGDPNNVTLMGQSAGAMCAMLHLISPLSQGLFHKVIALSGSPSNVILHNDRTPSLYARALSQKLGCYKVADHQCVLKYLQNQPLLRIMKESVMFVDWDYAHPMPWIPVIDSYCSEPMLPFSFETAVTMDKVAKVPVMMGACTDEGLILSAPFHKSSNMWSLLTSQWSRWAPLLFFKREHDEITETDVEASQDIKKFYFGLDNITNLRHTDDHLSTLKTIFSTAWFHNPMDSDSHLLADHGFQVYSFILHVQPAFSLMDIFRLSLTQLSISIVGRKLGFKPYNQDYGVCHGDDVAYLFPRVGLPNGIKTPLQLMTRERLVDFVASFAKNDKPLAEDLEQDVWEALDPEKGEHLQIGEKVEMFRDQEWSRQMQFWNTIKQKVAEGRLPNFLSSQPISLLFRTIAVKRVTA